MIQVPAVLDEWRLLEAHSEQMQGF